ncbi:preprotein translocase subunit SecA [Treponema parvum]|uniref:Protein translocase subunit SecA n=1 Tax=Treponema parvum TaxID=138851 RepID=A0A975IE86_9SPIR|nr:preprotein translocase subunit SecA [Treponema parvum]QTQ13633.1 preprotein translocase subunit SecA [Treponema parvum]
MIDKIMTFLFGSQSERDIKTLRPIVEKVNAKESWAASLPAEEFPKQTQILKDRIKNGETLESILPEAFALAREASKRVLGERPYDVQIMGAIVLNSGRITEMKTGEGKTLMCVAAAYLNSLSGKGVHIVTVNDYLAERDADWMRPVYAYLGQTVGSILSNMDNEARKAAYNCDITYGTNNELGFDYLRDNMQIELNRKVQRGFNFAVVDEIDSILIDEARTPLIISGAGEDDTFKYYEVEKYVNQLTEVEKDPVTGLYPDEVQMEAEERKNLKGDYTLDEKSRRVSFTDAGMNHIDEILHKHNLIKGTVFDEENFEYVHYFTQAVRAHRLYKNEVDYLVRDGQVQIVDEFTGRVLEGRRYGDGLHQAIEAKEHIRIAQRNRTMATITFQNFFRMYKKLSGMTGTAATEAVEFNKIYKLDVVVIPTNKPVIRKDENDEVYLNEEDKWNAICNEISSAHDKGQPILVGTISVEKSEYLSSLLTRKGVRHEVLNAKNHAREAMIIAEAGAKGSVTIATNMAGRGTDIKLGGNPEFRARKRAGTNATPEQYSAAYAVEKEKWLKDCDEVRSLGGLYVIGTERHESRRIDNQLRGRSGRQGDPGRSKFFISMDDDLMRLFGGERMKNIMRRIGMEPGEPIYHPWLNKGIENAQRKVEERNFEIRKHLLEYDDVLNEQRNVIYQQRDSILGDDDLADRVMNNAKDIANDIFDDYGKTSKNTKDNSAQILSERLKQSFGMLFSPDQLNRETVLAALQNDLTEKTTLAGKENLNMFIRYQYIQSIDKKWLDQLETLESLREGVSLRSYGSKNPLTEYKIDGFNIFYDMLDAIREEIVSKVFKVRIQVNPSIPREVKPQRQIEAKHSQASSSFSGDQARRQASGGAMQKSSTGAGVTVRRTVPKVGRNDPCPCGSGKKYKNCCGRNA